MQDAVAADAGHAEGLTVAELPQMPLSEIFHAFLGWSDGLMLFLEEPRAVMEIVGILERKHGALVEELASRSFDLALSPDNLDAQFITESSFEEKSRAGLRARAARILHEQGKELAVHVGGPVSRLLPWPRRSGRSTASRVSAVHPKATHPLQKRALFCGPSTILWGGIAQDYLLPTHSDAELASEARACFDLAAADRGMVVGVADKVPVSALPERIQTLADMAATARQEPFI